MIYYSGINFQSTARAHFSELLHLVMQPIDFQLPKTRVPLDVSVYHILLYEFMYCL